MVVAYFHRAGDLFVFAYSRDRRKVRISAQYLFAVKRLFFPDDHLVFFEAYFFDVCGISQSDAQPFPLTDRVVYYSFVLSENISFFVNERSFSGLPATGRSASFAIRLTSFFERPPRGISVAASCS